MRSWFSKARAGAGDGWIRTASGIMFVALAVVAVPARGAPKTDVIVMINGDHLTGEIKSLEPALTGCVKPYASMQAHEGRALKTALKPISGENTYAMAA